MTSPLDLLIEQVDDQALRARLHDEYAKLRKGAAWGRLNFEAQADEAVRVPKAKIARGATVQPLSEPGPRVYTVRRIVDGIATIVRGTEEPREVPVADLIVARQLGDPVYTGLTPLGQIRQGGDKPAHLIIQGENYHALQTLLYTHEGRVDLIYIDPPYNTGAGDWIYNDRYVGDTDEYRHSKWLAFMDKRLRLAKRLLSPNGVIIVAIDDNEHHRLRVLMDDVFGERNFISNVVWQGGRKNDSRFVSNGADYMLLYGKDVGSLAASGTRWREEKVGVDSVLEAGRNAWHLGRLEAMFLHEPTRQRMRDHRSFAEPSWENAQTDPALMENAEKLVADLDRIAAGTSIERKLAAEILDVAMACASRRMRTWFKSQPKESPVQAMSRYVYFFPDGMLARDSDITWPGGGGPSYAVFHPKTNMPVPVPALGWRFNSPERMQQAIDEGWVIFREDHTKPISLKKRLEDVTGQVAMSVFDRQRTHSTRYLASVLGSKDFPFPKDVDVISRWVNIATANNREAVILDFFGGTGTTAEAVMRLNAQDDGRRQAILVTNNELGQKDAKRLAKEGFGPGDPEWEAEGVFEKVTRPRLETVVTAVRRDGSSLEDAVIGADGKKIASGISGAAPLEENIVFSKLGYLDRTRVELGAQFAEIALLLYAQAGATGRVITEAPAPFEVADSYAILTDVGARREFADAVHAADGIRHVYIVDDDLAQYQAVAALLDESITTHHLYEDYLVNFAINTGAAL